MPWGVHHSVRGKAKLFTLGILCLIVFAACAGASENPTVSGMTAAPEAIRAVLHDFEAVDQLKVLFNQGAGQIRLILILSPT